MCHFKGPCSNWCFSIRLIQYKYLIICKYCIIVPWVHSTYRYTGHPYIGLHQAFCLDEDHSIWSNRQQVSKLVLEKLTLFHENGKLAPNIISGYGRTPLISFIHDAHLLAYIRTLSLWCMLTCMCMCVTCGHQTVWRVCSHWSSTHCLAHASISSPWRRPEHLVETSARFSTLLWSWY